MTVIEIAKLFPNGGSQAISLAKKLIFQDSTELYIHNCAHKLFLESIHYSWKSLLDGLAFLPDDFTVVRDEPDYQYKGDLF